MKWDRSKSLVLGLWLLAVVSGVFLDRWHEELFLPPPEERTAEDVMVDVFGDVKGLVARYLWFKMDLFHEVLDEQGVSAERQSEVLPLLRMVSLLDPTITDAFDQIAWDLFWGHQKVEEALSILEEGLRRNPTDNRLHFRKGIILFKVREFQKAMEAVADVASLTEDEFEKMDGYRILYWSAKELNDTQVMRETLKAIFQLRPRDPLWLREQAELDQRDQKKDGAL